MTPLRLYLLGMHLPVLSPSATHFCLQTPRSAEGQWPRCQLPVSAASVQVLGFAHGHIQGQEKPPLAPQHHCYRHPAEQSSAMCHHEWCVPISGRLSQGQGRKGSCGQPEERQGCPHGRTALSHSPRPSGQERACGVTVGHWGLDRGVSHRGMLSIPCHRVRR